MGIGHQLAGGGLGYGSLGGHAASAAGIPDSNDEPSTA